MSSLTVQDLTKSFTTATPCCCPLRAFTPANLHTQIKLDQLRPLPSIATANARPTPKSAAHLVPARAASWTIANLYQTHHYTSTTSPVKTLTTLPDYCLRRACCPPYEALHLRA